MGIPPEAGDDFRTLLGYEAAKHTLSHRFNRYAWVVEPPTSVANFDSDRAFVIGEYYSLLVQVVMAHIEDKRDINWTLLNNNLVLAGPIFADRSEPVPSLDRIIQATYERQRRRCGSKRNISLGLSLGLGLSLSRICCPRRCLEQTPVREQVFAPFVFKFH